MNLTYLREPKPAGLEDQPRDQGHLVDRVEKVQVKVADGVEGRPVKAQTKQKEGRGRQTTSSISLSINLC